MKRVLFLFFVSLGLLVVGCGDEETGNTNCTTDKDCPRGEFCETNGLCSYDCQTDLDCGSGKKCDTGNGKCVTKSTPKKKCSETCSGCCSGETCYAGTSRSQCGIGGGQCSSCSGSDICNNGYCGTCTSHSQCGSSEICVASQGCQAAFGRKWKITVSKAKINQNIVYDPAKSPPDCYVVLKVGSNSTTHSKVIADTYTPQWDYSVEVTLNQSDAVFITIYEWDDWTSDEFVGGIEYKSGVSIADLQKGSHTWTATDSTYGLQELHYSFSPK